MDSLPGNENAAPGVDWTQSLGDPAPKPYLYQPLDRGHIRLVSVNHDELTGQAVCEFRIVQLEHVQRQYFAISYCWGDPTRISKMRCGSNRYLWLTHSVHEILLWLLNHGVGGWFWIDFLSINQSDTKEKAEQVAMMGQVFALSNRVCAWLGQSVEGGDAATEVMKRMAADMDEASDHGKLGDEMYARIWQKKSYASEINTVKNFLHQPWFSRAWVVQEVVMAPEVLSPNDLDEGVIIYCNTSGICWDDLAFAVKLLAHGLVYSRNEFDDHSNFLDTMRTVQNIRLIDRLKRRCMNDETTELADGLRHCMLFDSTDPRDKVYSVMNMCKSLDGANLSPDYDSPVEDIYTRVSCTMINTTKSLAALIGAGTSLQPCNSALPSWVPDYKTLVHSGLDWARIQNDTFLASGSQGSEAKCDFGTRCLTVPGVYVDTFEQIFDLPQSGNENPNMIETDIGPAARHWVNMVQNFVDQSSQYAGLPEKERSMVLSRTVAGTSGTFSEEQASRLFVDGFRLWLEDNDRDTIDWRESLSPEETYLLELFEDGMGTLATSRIFGTRERGLLGLAREGARKGDTVCILYGADYPWILRPNEQRDGVVKKWKLVCECYLDGLMHGEGLDVRRKQTFVIA